MDYNLKLNETQVEMLAQALDLYTRIKLGQFHVIVDLFRNIVGEPGESIGQLVERIENADRLVHKAKAEIFPKFGATNAAHSIRSSPCEAERITYDILQVIKHRLAWDQKAADLKSPRGVWGEMPYACSKEPLPNIEKLI